MIHTPGFVQGSKDISGNYLITNKAKIPKQLMVMSFAVSLSLFLIMPMSQEWFFTFGANKMFNVPIFAESSNDSLFDGTMTSTTNGNTHLVVTSKTVEFSLQFSGFRIEFYSTSIAVEMVRMVWFSLSSIKVASAITVVTNVMSYLVLQWSPFINDGMTLETNILSDCSSFFSGIAFMAQSSSGIFDESLVSKWDLASFASEAEWVPIVVQCLDHPPCLLKGNKSCNG